MSIQLTIYTLSNMQLLSMANQYICVGGLDMMSFSSGFAQVRHRIQ